jgi:hypothetical protein
MGARTRMDVVQKKGSYFCPDSVVYSATYSLYQPDILAPKLKIVLTIFLITPCDVHASSVY